MNEIIGIKSIIGFNLEAIKRDLFLFDKIHIVGLRQVLPSYNYDEERKIVKTFLDVFIDLYYQQVKVSFESEDSKQLLNEIEWLASEDKIVLNDKDIIFGRHLKGDISVSMNEALKIDEYFMDKAKENIDKKTAMNPDFINHAHEISVRDKANIFNSRKNVEAYPIVKNMSLPFEISSKKLKVVQLLLNRIPVLDKDIPWNDIFQFKNDPETKQKFLALRNWIADLAQTDLSVNELEDKIEYAFQQYEKHLQINKMKFKKSVLETVVVQGSELLENLIKLKIGKIAKEIFEYKQLEINVLESELNAAGKEIAYINRIEKKFTKKKGLISKNRL